MARILATAQRVSREELEEFVRRRHHGTLVTRRRDDSPQMSPVTCGLDEQGALRRFVNVYVGNDDVRFLEALDTSTPDGAQVSVIPAVAGG